MFSHFFTNKIFEIPLNMRFAYRFGTDYAI